MAGNAYGSDDWDDEKAKSLGIPVIPDGAVSPLQLGIVVEQGNFCFCQLSFILALILAYY